MFEPRILAGGQQVERLALQRRHPGGVAAVEAKGQLDELARSGPRGDGQDGDGTLGVCGHLWFPGWCVLYSARRITALIRRWRDRKSTRLNSSHYCASRMPSSA